ncbi:hypothetical protein LOTGIDRAFT_155686 [Lottia gigantea]|uniref:U2A'/phosphoprotein 32 family A C-terminal domain-containing protein n=1 Tax=Lottia gigantea TaxID=225164 RepID=V3ZJW1_LOTGI|nr:hypothetical protein LOTGIDRAFT_155686 [Lottia gigantea]ESO82670.1 hypothetical protein LOTGIDRAFT_155686 [Lottia gigantea]
MALILTEEIIRDRVNLIHENLGNVNSFLNLNEDVKALSLPGTYHEKFVALGKSLRKFSRLKELDLSRNNIESLEVEMIRYYNGISSLDELKRLKYNSNLRDIDLRLNPVTRNEPDYRLYLIHMLPNLQKLDDRGVRDRERQAALTHFSTGQATEMTYHPVVEEEIERQPNPRVTAINKLTKGSTVLDDDDVAVIDLVSRNDGDLNKPRPVTGSNNKQPKSTDYSLTSLTKLADKESDRIDVLQRDKKQSAHTADEAEAMTRLREKYPNIPVDVLQHSPHYNNNQQGQQQHRQDGFVRFQDEEEAFTKYKSHGYFTANPHQVNDLPESQQTVIDTKQDEEIYPQFKELPNWTTPLERQHGDKQNKRNKHTIYQDNEIEQTLEELGIPKYHKGEARLTETEERIKLKLDSNKPYASFLYQLLDIVDHYWNGSKSLHNHVKFKEQALTIVQKYFGDNRQNELVSDNVQKQIARLKEENRLLRQQIADQTQLNHLSSGEEKIKRSLKQAQHDLEILQEEVTKYVAENKNLKIKLKNQEQQNVASNQSHIEELERKNEALSHEVEGLRVRLKQFAQLQELTNMLQESHTALVQTNEHLLKELEDEQHRHRHEVEQLHWSYDQLKKSLSFSRDKTNLSRSYNGDNSEL